MLLPKTRLESGENRIFKVQTDYMKLVFSILFTGTVVSGAFGQKNKEEQAIVDEGKALYKTEMASWYGTDLFLEQFPGKRDKIGGYLSYSEGDRTQCIFFDRSETPQLLATISFDSTFAIATAQVDSVRTTLSETESSLYAIRQLALAEINSDTLFKSYKNTNLNLIPLIWKGEKKVYVLTGPKVNGVVIFGNDYLLTFDKANKLTEKKCLHQNIIAVDYDESETDSKQVSAMHSHLPETGDLITVTDICTLMLYGKYAGWESHMVVGEKSVSIWSCESNSLAVISRDTLEKIEKDQEKRKKKKQKN